MTNLLSSKRLQQEHPAHHKKINNVRFHRTGEICGILHCPLLSVMSYTATWQLWKHEEPTRCLMALRHAAHSFCLQRLRQPCRLRPLHHLLLLQQDNYLPWFKEGPGLPAQVRPLLKSKQQLLPLQPRSVSTRRLSTHHSRSCILPLAPAEGKHTKYWVPKKYFFEPTQYVLRLLALV